MTTYRDPTGGPGGQSICFDESNNVVDCPAAGSSFIPYRQYSGGGPADAPNLQPNGTMRAPTQSGSTASGSASGSTAANGLTSMPSGQGGTGREGRGSTSGGGATTGPTPDQMNSQSGIENLPSGQWYSNLADQLFGQQTVLNDPATFWMTYANRQLGLGPFSSTGAWEASNFGNPYGLSAAMGNNMTSNAGMLAGQTALGNLLGNSRTAFDPQTLIRNVISQVTSFNPSQVDSNGNLRQGGSQLGLELWDPNPLTTIDNITSFLVGDNGILRGIVAAPLFKGLQNALLIAGNNIKQGIITDSHGLENVDRSGGTTAYAGNQLLRILGSFGVL